ncbi:hypothetical protein EDC96DRAFT_491659 [Choanephora cucurbitarum]|nr:hypothetical protein EDC96DRAFT_491659 [Choanephora cucurbitarum]
MSFVTIEHTNIKPRYRTKDDRYKRVHRNFAGLPSDSEEDDGSVSTTSSSLQDEVYFKQPKVKTIVPSDDSDTSSQDVPLQTAYPKRTSRQDGLYRSAPSLPHHLKQQEVHQAHRSTEDIKRLMHTKQMRMSGMDLLIQREQEKAKRQKPKINPAKVKIEGLLARLPEPGAHNINFQQALITRSPTPSHSIRNKRETSCCSLSPNPFPPLPTGLDYRNRAHYSMPSGYFMVKTMARSGNTSKQPIGINHKKQQRTPI